MRAAQIRVVFLYQSIQSRVYNISRSNIQRESLFNSVTQVMSFKLPKDHFIWSEEPFTAPIPTINTLLQNFEKNDLICVICSDFFDNPITLIPCHHSFCNRCIRDYCIAPACGAQRKCNKCPTCSTEIKKDLNKILVTNAGLNKVVQSYKKLRKVLYDSLVEWNGSTQTATSPVKPSQEDEGCDNGMDDRPAHKRPRRSQTASYNEENSTVIDLTDDVKPIISLPPLNFGILPSKLKQLKIKCTENGIDDYGKSAEELKQKLQRFQEFWNSEVSRPEQTKTKEEIIAQFNKEESVKRMSSSVIKTSFVSSTLKKGGGWNEVLLHRATYNDFENGEESGDFTSLLRELKRRRLEEHARPLEQFIFHSQKYKEKWLNVDVKETNPVVSGEMHPRNTDHALSTVQSASLAVNSMSSVAPPKSSAINMASQRNGTQGNILKVANASVSVDSHAVATVQQTSYSTQQAMPKPTVQNPYSLPSAIVNHNSVRSYSNKYPISNMNGRMSQMINHNYSFANGPKAMHPSIPKKISNPYAKKQGPSF